jgi:phenol 2-monooxygenase
VNLSWKLALCIRGGADPRKVLPTYDTERRFFANKVIRFSGAFLRFVCNFDLPLASLRGLGDELETHDEALPIIGASTDEARQWLRAFFGRVPKFMQGLGYQVSETVLSPTKKIQDAVPISQYNGVRAPNPRVCFSASSTSYLYDAMLGLEKFHILVFASDLQGPVRESIARLSGQAFSARGFLDRFCGRERFNVLLVTKALPHEAEELLSGPQLQILREIATVVYDDRAPDEDAHYCYGLNSSRGLYNVCSAF